jgi:hypothetical protein
VAICLLYSSLREGTTRQSFCFSVLLHEITSFLFPRNDSGLCHCEEARRGKLFIAPF